MCGTLSTCSTRCPRCRCLGHSWSGWPRLAKADHWSVARLPASCWLRRARGCRCTEWSSRPQVGLLPTLPSCWKRLSSTDSEVAGLQATVSALQAQSTALRQLVIIHDRLSAMVLQGADVVAVTRMLAELVGR